MAKLIYSVIASLDGYVADEDGNFDWAAPDEEVHAFINDLDRPVGTYLYGRRMYETMVGWETDPTLADQSPPMRDFAEIWQAADKLVYSRTLQAVSTARIWIERDLDPEAVRQTKALAGRDLIVGGPSSPPGRSGPGWSMSATCSSHRWWWEAASGPCPTTSAWSSNCWTNAVSAAASFAFTTALGGRDEVPPRASR